MWNLWGWVDVLFMREIELTQDKVTIVDDDIYDYLCQWKWCASKHNFGHDKFYAVRNKRKNENGPSKIYIHRAVYEYYFDELPNIIDHKDGNTLNNVIDNLRSASPSQNNFNKIKTHNLTSSQYKGVCWSNYREKWQAYIRIDGVQQHIAFCKEEHQAALLYNQKAVELFGEFANLNVIEA